MTTGTASGCWRTSAAVEIVVPGHGHVGDGPEFRRRVAADRAYLDAVAAGADIPDERLTEEWLRTEHARALARARALAPAPQTRMVDG